MRVSAGAAATLFVCVGVELLFCAFSCAVAVLFNDDLLVERMEESPAIQTYSKAQFFDLLLLLNPKLPIAG